MIYSDISGGLNPFNLSDIDDKWGAMCISIYTYMHTFILYT
jgi:hypothetical protein